jgi:tetratricopeptide (TPR) repeat protein
VNRQFHNVTAHYNGYYWARENIKEGLDKIQRATADDFGKLIPLFVYGDEKTVKNSNSYFDKALEKESRVIKYHSMNIKGKEYCKWIPANYLVLGEAHFYKKEYYDAIDVFEFIVRSYPKTQVKYQALLWLIRTYNAQNSVLNTQATIDLLDNDKAFPKKFTGEFAALQADYYLMMDNYDKAVQELKKAIPLTHNKKQKARFIYVLAQIEEMKGNTKQATQYYEEVARLHPPYDMYFSSKIKRAMTVQGGSDATQKVKKELKKMLRDEKNFDFRDQIYYAMAEIATKEHDTVQALKFLKASTAASAQNTRQRGMSFLREGDIYFQQMDYQNAQAYYDSAVGYLPKDFKDYDFIVNKKNSLNGLVKNLKIISNEDSLLKVAALDSNKRNALIKKIIADLTAKEKKEEEEKKLAAQQQQSNTNGSSGTSNGSTGTTNAGAWYFYNSSSISFGFADFAKKWGPRQLEDNWRRSNKEAVIPENVEVNNTKVDTSKNKKTELADNKKPGYYLKDIPFTEEAKEDARTKIIEAYNNVGGIYKEQLRNYDRSIETFETLNRRYPGNKYELQNYYQLYRLFLLKKNQKQTDYYKNLILTKYPDTEFAKIIKNPDYNKELQASKNVVEKYYTETFDAYNAGRYNDVLAMVTQADSLYGGSDLMPKFALLRAYSIGRTQSIQDYENALTKIIIKYPKDAATKKRAQELIDEIKRFKSGKGNDTSRTSGADTTKALFNLDLETEHWVTILIPNKKQNVNEFKVRLSDFNAQFFPLAQLTVSSSYLGMDYLVFNIKAFENSTKAMDYYQLIVSDQNVFKDIDQSQVSLVVITPDNYKVFFTQKKKDEYVKFFKENYLRK